MANLQVKRRSLVIIGVLVLAGIAGTTYTWYKTQQPSNNTAHQVRGITVQQLMDEQKDVTAILSGEAVANNSTKLKIDTSRGEVQEIMVKEGETVTAGQPLFKYRTDQDLTAKTSDYDAQSKAKVVENSRNAAGIKWGTYNRKLEQLNALKQKYQTSNDESLLEQIKSSEDELAQSLEAAQTADNEVSQAEIEYEKALVTAQTEQEKTDTSIVRADFAGKVVQLNADLANQSKDRKDEETFMELIDQSKMMIKGEVSEFDRDKVAIGQKVEVVDRVDATKRWTGTLTQVGNLTLGGDEKKEQENPNQSKYPYKVELAESEQLPTIGTHHYVRLLNNPDSLGKVRIPKNYILQEKGGSFVWKIVDGKVKKEAVEVDVISDTVVEIKQGLQTEDKIVPPMDGIKEGMKEGDYVNT